jgi:hypothetical protein
MADDQVISQLKERVAFLEALVMSLVAKNEPSLISTATQANTDSAKDVQHSSATIDKTSEQRIAFLEGLVMSLVTKNEPSANPVATQAKDNPAKDVQPVSATTIHAPQGELPYLMRLPIELRMDILERVLHPVFADSPYGLIPPLPFLVTMRTSKTRFPAALHVSHTMRGESMKIYVDQAQKMIADLETENKQSYQEHLAYRKLNPTARSIGSPLYGLESKILQNFNIIKSLVSVCNATKGAFERTEPAERSYGRDA